MPKKNAFLQAHELQIAQAGTVKRNLQNAICNLSEKSYFDLRNALAASEKRRLEKMQFEGNALQCELINTLRNFLIYLETIQNPNVDGP